MLNEEVEIRELYGSRIATNKVLLLDTNYLNEEVEIRELYGSRIATNKVLILDTNYLILTT
jgi:hypothetical protein